MSRYELYLIQPKLNEKHLLESVDSMKAVPINLITIANYTPNDFRVCCIDENVREIPFKRDIDLVGISIHSHSCAERAYQVANRFRKMGVPVILGGLHCSIFLEENGENPVVHILNPITKRDSLAKQITKSM